MSCSRFVIRSILDTVAVALLVLSWTGCYESRSPTEPDLSSAAPPPAAEAPSPSSPALPPTTEKAVPGTYERVTPRVAEIDDYFESDFEERYVVDPDGRFRLEYESAEHGVVVYAGTYSLDVSHYVFQFDADPRWLAFAGFQGACLVVNYSVIMALDGFDDAEYCRVI